MNPPIPQAMTSAMETTWVLSAHRSLSNFRSIAFTMKSPTA
jgi:hypothetical protein